MSYLLTIVAIVVLLVVLLAVQNRLLRKRFQFNRDCDHLEHLADLGLLAGGLAHEIRNPLNAISFGISSLRQEIAKGPAGSPADVDEIAAELQEEIAHLNQILGSFLQFARPDQESTSRFNLIDVCQDVVRSLQKGVESERKITLTAPAGSCPVELPRVRLREILYNLVLNAVQLSPSQAPVEVKVLPHRDAVTIEVIDDGPGIDLSMQHRLFQPFFSNRKDGTGLGLAISRRLVTEMGGTITYEPHVPRGSIFRVTVPQRCGQW